MLAIPIKGTTIKAYSIRGLRMPCRSTHNAVAIQTSDNTAVIPNGTMADICKTVNKTTRQTSFQRTVIC